MGVFFKSLVLLISTVCSQTIEELTASEDWGIQRIVGAEAYQRLHRYGCWCYFEDAYGNQMDEAGNPVSQPVDYIDNLCRLIHLGYQNITSQGVCGSTPPWKVDYFDIPGNTEAILSQNCALFNQNQCQIEVCKVHGYFKGPSSSTIFPVKGGISTFFSTDC